MRLISFSVTVLLTFLSSAAPAQQSPGTTSDTIGRPPPLPGPPPISGPPSTTQAPAASTPRASEPPKDPGANGPAGTPPYSKAELPQVNIGPGLNVVAPDGSTKTVKAVPCSTAARETDGTTTCVGIPDKGAWAKPPRSRSCRHAHRHRKSASILRELQDRGIG